ncbi:MAG: ankyrin repeat domain-containing protein [Gemmatimonadota bacterium]
MKVGLRLSTLGAMCLMVLAAAGPPESPVADAAMRGDVESVVTLLRRGADVNAAQGDGMTALHWAAERGDVAMAEVLHAAGAQLEPSTRIGGYVPLHVAAREGNEEMVRWLLEAGVEVDRKTTETQANALHMASTAGDVAVVSTLLDFGADPNSVEGHWQQTPLVFAAAENRADVIRLLISRGADPNVTTSVRDLVEWSKLMRAADQRRDEVLAAFTNDGARDPKPSELQAAVRAGREVFTTGLPEEEEEEGEEDDRRRRGPPSITAKGGLSPLLHATRQGHTEAIDALLEGGADPNLVSPADGTSPLLMSVINGQFDISMRLLEHGADPNVASNLNGVAPLWAAINAEWQPRTRYPQPQQRELQSVSYLDVMSVLLDAGADPNHRITMHPWYMVYTGCGNRNCGLIDTNGSTAFLRASYATDVAAMRLLVEHGADPNISTKAPAPRDRRTPDEFLRQQNVQELQSDDFASLTDSAKFVLLRSVRDDFPDEIRYRFDDEIFAMSAADVLREQILDAVDEANEVLANQLDPSGLPPVDEGGPAVHPIHAATGVGYGEGFAGNAHRTAPGGWMPALTYLVEELGVDVNVRDHNGYNAVHHAAARGDNDMVLYLVEHGADIMAVSRRGQTTVDMANGPVQRVSPFPATVALLESLGAINNHNCLTC